MSDDVAQATKKVLADSFKFYLKAHGFHWNVEGEQFLELHKLFGKIYEEVWEALDTIAEEIRALDSYAPSSFTRFDQLSTIEDEIKIPKATVMIQKLLEDNNIVLNSIKTAFDAAEAAGHHGLSNLLADRQDAHKKHAWMLRSILK